MKLITVEGNFEGGQISLTEIPPGIRQARVIVTFLEKSPPEGRFAPIRFGELASHELIAAGRFSSEEDFKIAEYEGGKRWGDEDGK